VAYQVDPTPLTRRRSRRILAATATVAIGTAVLVAGLALAGLTSSNLASGPAAGGGALVEMDLTSRMALTLRAGANLARIDQAWSPAGSLAVGVALY
jgi:hypothetical protein